ncbi:glycosyltransferase family 2 protein [Vibrio parahaemolyticus]|nr:glycosyltransferase family 2 protein [Vibrio parahaemolyticus]
MSESKVSVVIPFYSDTPGRLLKAVNSALSQTISVEVIVVDDASPISAESELISLADDSRLTVIRHNTNTNGGVARSTGIKNATGEFIAFLDYDDFWYSEKLELQLDLYKKNACRVKEPEKIVIYSRCFIVDGKRRLLRPKRAMLENESVSDYLFCEKQIIQTSGIFLRATTAKFVGFDNLKRHQDYQFCLSLESIGCKFFMLEQPSYEFVQVPKLNDYNFSIKWLQQYGKYLTTDANRGFKSLVLLRSMVSHWHIRKAFTFAVKQHLISDFLKILFIQLVKKILIIIRTI